MDYKKVIVALLAVICVLLGVNVYFMFMSNGAGNKTEYENTQAPESVTNTSDQATVSQPVETEPTISQDSYSKTVTSGDIDVFEWSLPPGTEDASMMLVCPDGLVAELANGSDQQPTDATNVCNKQVDVSPTSTGIDGITFINLTTDPLTARLDISASLSGGQSLVSTGSSSVLVNPPSTSD